LLLPGVGVKYYFPRKAKSGTASQGILTKISLVPVEPKKKNQCKMATGNDSQGILYKFPVHCFFISFFKYCNGQFHGRIVCSQELI